MKLIKHASKDKLRGGFYTPEPIAEFVLEWALNGSTDSDILEPSCGDGNFLRLLRNKKFNSVTAVELDEEEAQKAGQINLKNSTIINADFHTYCNETENRYDIIIGNPPYIRYQYFSGDQQFEAQKIFHYAGLKYSKLMNAWVSFVVGSSLLLKEKGKIGFVVPAEILQVSYAQGLRKFLARFYNKINIVSFKKLVFPDIQQEVVLLLCEKNNTQEHLIEHLEVNDASDLKKIDVSKLRSPKKKIDFDSNKWTFYFLEQREIDFLEGVLKDNNLSRIGDFAKVEVGITTGSNPFFTVPKSTVDAFNLHEFAKPMVGRSVQVTSAIFTTEDWENNLNVGARANFLKFPSIKEINGNKKAIQYIKQGEEAEIHKGYKCRIRDEWQIVPSTRISDALFIRRNNLYPRLIINEANAYTTDTMHRVWVKDEVDIRAFIASYYNSMSLAFAEICGRSHGGGVLELMPNEAESIILPYHVNNDCLLDEIDSRLRNKQGIQEVLKFTNQQILNENFGFSKADIELADSIRRKLSTRRLTRGKKS
ncbi:Eco57I restriction-modification methylase domain-containing protein [Poritiphilus flavus]|uniref:site-specific DNA-methyltransferase (adenine-specific) n=1 Tax=Poritiphilus flavus TaxID=2697053 RepID=A0A6L9EG17_9FLAO|nr:class I SAM-dependent methyltransferase [Poritiphilus flavus]NAS13675.1 N-6 DNA methylase [Poritiphilus flavus]